MATATFAFPTPQYADTSSGQPAATSAGLPAQTAAPAPTGAPFTQIDSTQFVDVFEELTFDTRQSNDTRQSKDPTGNVSNLQGHTDSKPTPTLYPIAEEATQYDGTIRGPPTTTGNVPDPASTTDSVPPIPGGQKHTSSALPTAQKQSSLRNPQPPANTPHTNQSRDPKGDSRNLQDSLKDQQEHLSVEDSSQDGGGYDAKSIQGMKLHPDPEKGEHSLMEPNDHKFASAPPSILKQKKE